MTTGVELIAAERERQVTAEGWTSWHDDTHTNDELALAAACYALPVHKRSLELGLGIRRTLGQWLWPWDDQIKPAERVRELTKAGALIAAEIDRHLREGSTT